MLSKNKRVMDNNIKGKMKVIRIPIPFDPLFDFAKF